MHETTDDLARLQTALNDSFDLSRRHLRTAFDQKNRLSARELVDSLPGLFEMHLAVVTGDGAPLVAPVDGFFLRGQVCVGLPQVSVRCRLVRQDPRVSASFIGPSASFIVHGSLTEIDPQHHLSDLYEQTARSLYVAEYGDWFNDYLTQTWETDGRGFVGVIEPRKIFAKR